MSAGADEINFDLTPKAAPIRAAAPLTADQIASLRALLAARVGDRVALRIEQALSDMARAPGAFEMRGGDAAVSPAAAAVHPLISIPPGSPPISPHHCGVLAARSRAGLGESGGCWLPMTHRSGAACDIGAT